MQSSMYLLVLVALGCCLIAQIRADPLKMVPEVCSKLVDKLDGKLEEDGERLISIVEGAGYQNNESRIRQGIINLVDVAKQLGEIKGCAEGNIHEPGDVNKAKKEQLRETITLISGTLATLSPRSRKLFKDIIKEAQEAYNKL